MAGLLKNHCVTFTVSLNVTFLPLVGLNAGKIVHVNVAVHLFAVSVCMAASISILKTVF